TLRSLTSMRLAMRVFRVLSVCGSGADRAEARHEATDDVEQQDDEDERQGGGPHPLDGSVDAELGAVLVDHRREGGHGAGEEVGGDALGVGTEDEEGRRLTDD